MKYAICQAEGIYYENQYYFLSKLDHYQRLPDEIREEITEFRNLHEMEKLVAAAFQKAVL